MVDTDRCLGYIYWVCCSTGSGAHSARQCGWRSPRAVKSPFSWRSSSGRLVPHRREAPRWLRGVQLTVPRTHESRKITCFVRVDSHLGRMYLLIKFPTSLPNHPNTFLSFTPFIEDGFDRADRAILGMSSGRPPGQTQTRHRTCACAIPRTIADKHVRRHVTWNNRLSPPPA